MRWQPLAVGQDAKLVLESLQDNGLLTGVHGVKQGPPGHDDLIAGIRPKVPCHIISSGWGDKVHLALKKRDFIYS